MSWGDTFKKAFKAATSAARSLVDRALSSIAEAAIAVGRFAEKLGRAAVAVGKGALVGAGELANLAFGLSVMVGAAGYTVVTKPYFLISDHFGSGKSPKDSMEEKCPYGKPDILGNKYRKTLVNSHFHGEGSPALRDAMHELAKPTPPENLDEILKTIATERDRPIDQIKQEYEEFARQKEIVNSRIEAAGGSLEPIDALLPEQSNFMGSNWQLRYGKVVGDHFGFDPVFGALLNPTGGLVGPGNKGLAPDGALMPEAVAYHGAYHDAMGYLYFLSRVDSGHTYRQS